MSYSVFQVVFQWSFIFCINSNMTFICRDHSIFMKNIPQAYRTSYLWFWPPLILGGSVISAGTIHDLRRVKVPTHFETPDMPVVDWGYEAGLNYTCKYDLIQPLNIKVCNFLDLNPLEGLPCMKTKHVSLISRFIIWFTRICNYDTLECYQRRGT
jgi:hypothetical protein